MARLTEIKSEVLSKREFDRFPVWTWDDARDSHQPISEADPSPDDYDGLFIKAQFEANGHKFEGYLVGDESFFAFGLFVNDENFVFNLNLPDLMEENLTEIFRLLKCEPFKLFPLCYESPVRFKGGQAIAGTLNL